MKMEKKTRRLPTCFQVGGCSPSRGPVPSAQAAPSPPHLLPRDWESGERTRRRGDAPSCVQAGAPGSPSGERGHGRVPAAGVPQLRAPAAALTLEVLTWWSFRGSAHTTSVRRAVHTAVSALQVGVLGVHTCTPGPRTGAAEDALGKWSRVSHIYYF